MSCGAWFGSAGSTSHPSCSNVASADSHSVSIPGSVAR